MRYRDNKIFATGRYYHIFNRGNGKENIFLDQEDFFFFLRRMKENLFPESNVFPVSSRIYKRKLLPVGAFDLLCYCLMPNHFHWLIKQNTELPISKLLLKVSTGYSIYYNRKYTHIGHVFQDQFKAVMVDSDSYLKWLSVYIHQNPKVAGLVDDLQKWEFSSYPDYVLGRPGKLCNKSFILDLFSSLEDYKKFNNQAFDLIKQRKQLEHLLLDDV